MSLNVGSIFLQLIVSTKDFAYLIGYISPPMQLFTALHPQIKGRRG